MPEGGALATLLAAANVVGLKVHLGLAWPSSTVNHLANKPTNGSYALYYRQMAWLQWDTAVELWSLYGDKYREDIVGVYTMIEESNSISWFSKTTDLTGHYLEPLARDIKQNLRCLAITAQMLRFCCTNFSPQLRRKPWLRMCVFDFVPARSCWSGRAHTTLAI